MPLAPTPPRSGRDLSGPLFRRKASATSQSPPPASGQPCITSGLRVGQMLPAMAFMALVLCLIAGLVADLGHVFEARRSLINRAERAARAAANEVDLPLLMSRNVVALDARQAQAVAEGWLAPESGQIEISAGGSGGALDTVTIRLSRNVPTSFMRLVGWHQISIKAQASARLELRP